MKVNIIGAGVSGLAVGCYLQMNGFETTIFEKHNTAGGLCTSWKRGDYTFDGCIHWLFGSNSSNPFHKLWSELMDIEAMEFVNHNVRIVIEVKENINKFGDKLFRLYTDIDILRDYLLELAPEDTRMINKLIRAMRKIQHYEMPPMVDQVIDLLPLRKKMGMINQLPLLAFILKWKDVTNYSFAKKLRNPFLKEAFELLYDGDEINLLIMMVPLAFNDSHGAGYPLGGSTPFAKKIEDKYRALGGNIVFNSPVKKIQTIDDRATGVELQNGHVIDSDITISAADWHFTVFDALDGSYTNKLIRLLGDQKKLKVYYSIFMVALGVSGTFDDLPHFFRFPLDVDLVSPDGSRYSRMEVHVYNYDTTMAPAGKTVITVSYYTVEGNYWIDLRNSNKAAYDSRKTLFAQQIIDALDKKIARIKPNIEVTDVATPATYHRYTSNRQGSVQGWLPGKNLSASSPVKMNLPGLQNFYFTGHWAQPGGGLPVAIKTGRDIAQVICHKHRIPFSTK
ncbi:MAG: NAD(P)/FAD-dependent oxidoreductase [Bacteroidota bacterium]